MGGAGSHPCVRTSRWAGAASPAGASSRSSARSRSGKTTLALTVVASAQKAGGVAAFIDAEHALDPSWARKLGVNIDDLLVSQPDTGEQALDICELLVRSNAVDVIVVDSVAALIPRAEIEGEMGDTHVGLQARLMSQAMRKLTGVIARSNCTVIFINQIREKIGVMFGSPETTPAAVPSSSTARSASTSAAPARSRTATRMSATMSAPRSSRTRSRRPSASRVRHHVQRGHQRHGDLIDLAVDSKVCEKSGSWFSYGEIRLGQGRERMLEENTDLLETIQTQVFAAIEEAERARENKGKNGPEPRKMQGTGA
jgi:recombination protein RecA